MGSGRENTATFMEHSVSEYERGRKDRREGHLPLDGMKDEYYKGYAFEYEKEQQEDARTYER